MNQGAGDVEDAKPESSRLTTTSICPRLLALVAAVALLLAQPSLCAQNGPSGALPDGPQPRNVALMEPVAQSSSAATAPLPGIISGIVADPSGAAISGAAIRLSLGDSSQSTLAKTDGDGVFSFAGLGPGQYRLLVSASGFAPKVVSVSLSAGQVYAVPQIALTPSTDIDVEVGISRTEMAEIEIDSEEKQRVFGVIPNFYVSYLPDAVPLTPKQKFKLAGRLFIDPVSFGITGLAAGVQQANNSYSGYGQGAAGYGKRYAAATGTFLDGVLIGNAILPSLLKQDPRYFYKGTGTIKSRILYAMAMSVVARGDNGRWQPDYSGILGGLAAAGISNAYYPAKDRNGAELTFVNAAIGTAGSAAGNIFQEFLVRKLTPHAGKSQP
jgi:hypothetical protein